MRQFAHPVVELLSQQVVLTLTIEACVQFEVLVVAIAPHVGRKHPSDTGSVLQFFDLLDKNSQINMHLYRLIQIIILANLPNLVHLSLEALVQVLVNYSESEHVDVWHLQRISL